MGDATATLTCPKCESPMRSYERNGIVIDQCTNCRGVFLDRGELERLMDAESAHYSEQRSGSGEREREKGFVGKLRDRAEGKPQHGKKRERGGFLEDFLGGE
jgi:Zn-finger nucleic acid-binding protein